MSRLGQLVINANGFVFDPSCGESFTANISGIFVLQGLQNMKSPQQITQELAEEYDVAPTVVERDVLDFVSHLKTYHLL